MSDSELNQRIHRLELLVQRHTGKSEGISINTLPHPNMHIDSVYTITNGTTDRTYDADTVAIAELADIVYTLIQDLKTLGILE